MRAPLPPALADWFAYLAEIGYGELRAPVAANGSASASGSARRPIDHPESSQAATGAPSTAGERPPSRPADGDESALAMLAERASGCRACRLAGGRNRVVFGSGPARARLMFVGEGPGAEEDRQGLPFVGKAGELLTRILAAMELRRDEVYIANIVKCRPPGNREPERDEVEACIGFLERQIDLVGPRILVCLGRVAAQTLLGDGLPISRLRGNWYSVRGVETMVTYHPAALLRNPALKRPTWDDMQKVRDRLREVG